MSQGSSQQRAGNSIVGTRGIRLKDGYHGVLCLPCPWSWLYLSFLTRSHPITRRQPLE
jgi:hypothetical protein